MEGERLRAMRMILRAMRLVGVGSIVVIPFGREIEAGYKISWPAEREERRRRVRQLAAMLGQIEGLASVLVVPSGVRYDEGDRISWPALAPGQSREPEVSCYVATEGTVEESEAASAGEATTGGASPEHNPFQVVAVVTTPPPLLSERCAEDILALLEAAERRLTLSEISQEFSARGIRWSYAMIDNVAPALRRMGKLSFASQEDQWGRGFGLPRWGDSDEG